MNPYQQVTCIIIIMFILISAATGLAIATIWLQTLTTSTSDPHHLWAMFDQRRKTWYGHHLVTYVTTISSTSDPHQLWATFGQRHKTWYGHHLVTYFTHTTSTSDPHHLWAMFGQRRKSGHCHHGLYHSLNFIWP